jgi:hypothetical protein
VLVVDLTISIVQADTDRYSRKSVNLKVFLDDRLCRLESPFPLPLLAALISMAKRGRPSPTKPCERPDCPDGNASNPDERQEKPVPTGGTGDRRFRLTVWHGASAGLALIMLALMWPASRGDSATMDEQNHIARGLTYLRTGSLRLNRMHPPLINIISAVPLALDRTITLPLKGPSWAASNLDGFALELL